MRVFGHFRRMCANDARHFDLGAGAAGDIGFTLPRQQQMPAAKYIERQITIIVIITVEKSAFLHAIQRDVGIIEIEHDLVRCTLMRLQENIDHQRINFGAVAIDLMIWRDAACSSRLSVLLPASASQSERRTGSNLPASTANAGSLRSSS